MRIAAYVRVSSKAQDHATQRDAISRVVDGPVVWYSEKLSGKSTNRPELQRLMADVRAGKLDRVVVFKVDRLTRSGVSDTFKLIEEFRAAGVTLHAVADNLVIRPDRDDTASECYVFALSLAAKLERAAINDRIAAARVRLDAAGEPWGRPPKMTAQQISTARRMKGEGRTVREISAALGVPRATVGRAVKDAA